MQVSQNHEAWVSQHAPKCLVFSLSFVNLAIFSKPHPVVTNPVSHPPPPATAGPVVKHRGAKKKKSAMKSCNISLQRCFLTLATDWSPGGTFTSPIAQTRVHSGGVGRWGCPAGCPQSLARCCLMGRPLSFSCLQHSTRAHLWSSALPSPSGKQPWHRTGSLLPSASLLRPPGPLGPMWV